MRARVAYSFNFEAAHKGIGFPDDHINSRIHGHSYLAELIAEGEVSEIDGTVLPLEVLESIAENIKPMLDHRTLNDVVKFPTMEYLAEFILKQALERSSKITSVRVMRPTVGMWAFCQAGDLNGSS